MLATKAIGKTIPSLAAAGGHGWESAWSVTASDFSGLGIASAVARDRGRHSTRDPM